MDLKWLKKLVETNSHSHNPEGLKKTGQILSEKFDLFKAKKIEDNGTFFYQKRPHAPVQILLGGHYDTVFPVNSTFQKTTKNNERWMGPGIADMKGGLFILFSAIEAFEKSAEAKNIGWRIFLNPDEEIGSPTSKKMIEKASKGAQAAFLFEPSLPNGDIVSSRKGSMNLKVTSFGKSAHAGRDLIHGKNAIVPLAELINHFKTIEGINFGSIQGGHAFNVVPDWAELKINLRSDKASHFKIFFEALEKFSANREIKHECLSYRPPKPLTKATKQLIKALDYPVETAPSGGVCDGNFIASLGIPTIDTLGAVGGNIHTHDEYIELSSLKQRTDLFHRFLIRLSKGEISLC